MLLVSASEYPPVNTPWVFTGDNIKIDSIYWSTLINAVSLFADNNIKLSILFIYNNVIYNLSYFSIMFSVWVIIAFVVLKDILLLYIKYFYNFF